MFRHFVPSRAVSYTHLDVYKRQASGHIGPRFSVPRDCTGASRIAGTPTEKMCIRDSYIAVAIDSQQSSPSQAQAKRMRELDEKKLLNGDVIDGIMMEDKKEVDKVILTGAELSKYFGKETTPREIKDQIIKLLDDWKGQQKEHEKPEKKTEQEK